MAKYSIKDLEHFTKIKAHTLRVWEQRYNLLHPERTDSNIRTYTETDLKRILNINLLYQNGLKISKIARLSEEEIVEQASVLLLSDEVNGPDEVNSFVRNILDLNYQSIRCSLERIVKEIGIERLHTEVLVPLLNKIGVLWQVDAITISHEHFLSNILREFLIVQIDRISPTKSSKGRVILFLKEAEHHELSLLFYHFLLKKRNYDCFYLGQSVPTADLKKIVQEVNPEYLFTSVLNMMTQEEVVLFFKEITAIMPADKVYAGGQQLVQQSAHVPSGIHIIRSVEDIDLN